MSEHTPDYAAFPPRLPWYHRAPVLTMALNLALILTIFLTRERWNPWVLIGSPIRPAYLIGADRPFSPDGKLFVLPGGSVAVVDLATGERRDVCSRGGGWASFSHDGRSIVAAAGSELRVIALNSGREMLFLRNPVDTSRPRGRRRRLHCVAFSPDGSAVIATDYDGLTARIWDIRTGKVLHELVGHTSGRIETACFSPDGTLAVTTGTDRTARVWDARTGVEQHCLRGHPGSVICAVFSPRGDMLLTCGTKDNAFVWDLHRYSIAHTLQGHEGIVAWGAFSDDGIRLATAGYDGTVRVWFCQDGELACVIKHAAPVAYTGFAPSSGLLVSCTNKEHSLRRFRRIRPEKWWGVFWLWHFWLIVALALAVAWSGWRDIKRTRREADAPANANGPTG